MPENWLMMRLTISMRDWKIMREGWQEDGTLVFFVETFETSDFVCRFRLHSCSCAASLPASGNMQPHLSMIHCSNLLASLLWSSSLCHAHLHPLSKSLIRLLTCMEFAFFNLVHDSFPSANLIPVLSWPETNSLYTLLLLLGAEYAAHISVSRISWMCCRFFRLYWWHYESTEGQLKWCIADT